MTTFVLRTVTACTEIVVTRTGLHPRRIGLFALATLVHRAVRLGRSCGHAYVVVSANYAVVSTTRIYTLVVGTHLALGTMAIDCTFPGLATILIADLIIAFLGLGRWIVWTPSRRTTTTTHTSVRTRTRRGIGPTRTTAFACLYRFAVGGTSRFARTTRTCLTQTVFTDLTRRTSKVIHPCRTGIVTDLNRGTRTTPRTRCTSTRRTSSRSCAVFARRACLGHIPRIAVCVASFDRTAIASVFTGFTHTTFANPGRTVLIGATSLTGHPTRTGGVTSFHSIAIASLGTRCTRTDRTGTVQTVGTTGTLFLHRPTATRIVANFDVVSVTTGLSRCTDTSLTEALVTVFRRLAGEVCRPAGTLGIASFDDLAVASFRSWRTHALLTGERGTTVFAQATGLL